MFATRRLLTTTATLALGLFGLATVASAHYHWVYFANRTSPFFAVPVQFNLQDQAGLPNSTVSFFVSDQGPKSLVPGDSFTAIVSQVQAAAKVWNDVSSSAIRLQFGGVTSVGTPQNSPGIDVVFDDNLPSGILALTKVTVPDDVNSIANGATFVPILRSRIQLPSSLATTQSPVDGPLASWKDVFFTILVHEFGHSLGLQHTKVSGAMTTLVTRTTTKASPLDPDDIAGISTLYPTGGFLSTTGKIRGTVSRTGTGMNLASVVALSPTTGAAIGGMTNPDGGYEISGIPPGDYILYAHPLPPNEEGLYPGDIAPPLDRQGTPFPADTGFVAQFFNGANGTKSWNQATTITVTGGSVTEGINFSVQKSNGPSLYDMWVYGYQGTSGQQPVQGPALATGSRTTLSFYAYGLVTNQKTCQFAAGLAVQTIGSAANLFGATCYQNGYGYFYVDAGAVSQTTPVAVVLTSNTDLYVLPAAFSIAPAAPPSITSVTPTGDGGSLHHATITGVNLRSDSRIFFDGVPATVIGANSDGSLTITAPSASAGYRAAVEALTSDGQTSSQALGSSAPPVFSYAGNADSSGVTVIPSSVAAGVDTMVEIDGVGTNFVDGQTAIGFGTSDITVRKLWVIDSTHLRLNISVNPAAQPLNTSVTVTSGLQLVTMSAAFQILPADPRQVSIRVPVVNAQTGFAAVPVGGTALISLSGPIPTINTWTLTIDGQRVPFTMNVNSQLAAVVPPGASIGPVIVRLTGPNGETLAPVLMQVDQQPPAIVAISGANGPLDATHPVHIGETITLGVIGLGDLNNPPPCSSVHINVGGVDYMAGTLSAVTSSGTWQVTLALGPTAPPGVQNLTIAIDMRQSAPVTINVVRN
jgi:uncharacterized protein (TIGR03437 family)